jgi:hypothetical protein
VCFRDFAAALSTDPNTVEIWQCLCGIALSREGHPYIDAVVEHFKTALVLVDSVKRAHVLALATLLLKVQIHQNSLHVFLATLCVRSAL